MGWRVGGLGLFDPKSSGLRRGRRRVRETGKSPQETVYEGLAGRAYLAGAEQLSTVLLD